MPAELSLPDGFERLCLPQQKQVHNQDFPLVLQASRDQDITLWLECIKREKFRFHELLLKYGVLFFRGFPLKEAQHFDEFVKSFGFPNFPYVGGAAPRNVVVGDVVTSNESPPDQKILFHHEMAQVPNFPKVVFFYCDIPAPEGGETPIVSSTGVYEEMSRRVPTFVSRLEKEGLRYFRVLSDGDDPTSSIGRGWQSTYQTQDRSEAERRAAEQGTEYKWREDGCLETRSKIVNGVRLDERTGRKTWFNSLGAYIGWEDSRNDPKKAVTFPNGDLMLESNIDTMIQVQEELSVAIPWQQGDVYMIDNRQVMHGRRSFVPPRRILASLCAD